MTGEVPIRNCLGGGGAGGAEGVVGGLGAGDRVATTGRQHTGTTQMVAEDVEEAVVGGRWVAADAGGDGAAG